MPTRSPAAASAYARFTAVVDLPTPPLQLATATMWPTSPTPATAADCARDASPSPLLSASACSADRSDGAGAAAACVVTSKESEPSASQSTARAAAPRSSGAAVGGAGRRRLDRHLEGDAHVHKRRLDVDRAHEVPSETRSASACASAAMSASVASSTSDRTSRTSDWRSSASPPMASAAGGGQRRARRSGGGPSATPRASNWTIICLRGTRDLNASFLSHCCAHNFFSAAEDERCGGAHGGGAEGLTLLRAENSTGFKCVSRTNNGSKPFQAA